MTCHQTITTEEQALRQALLDTALLMEAKGINQGTSGNLSCRWEEGYLITPSGMKYHDCTPEDIVFMTLGGQSYGRRKPSSEWRFHHDIYAQQTEVEAVLHAHSTWCTTLACLNRPIPAFHYMVAVAGGNDIPLVPYATFGTQALSDHINNALSHRKACLLANHGMVCTGTTLEGVFDLAIEVEHLAKIYCQTLQVGDPVILNDEQMQQVLEKFKSYGANAQETAE